LANKRLIDWIGPLRNYAFPLVVSRQFLTFATAAWPQGRALALLLHCFDALSSERITDTASAEARAQCAAQPRILHSLDRSRRRQRNPGDQDRSRAGQRVDVPRPTESERNENSLDDHVCSQNGSRASIGRIRRRTGLGPAANRCRQDFL
jgi:hypothetical protein